MALTEDQLQEDGYSPGEEKPLRSYRVLMAVFSLLSAAFAHWFHRSERELPDRVSAGDLALITIASHKASRLISKDRVTSGLRAPFTRFAGPAGPGEVSEQPRGEGFRRAIGELLICPYCLGMWLSAGFVAGLLVVPRFTRWTAAVLTALFGADLLQIAYKKAEDLL